MRTNQVMNGPFLRSQFACRIRKTWLEGASIGVVGTAADLTYPYEHLGEGASALEKLSKGGAFADKLKNAKFPAVVVGPGILKRSDRDRILSQVCVLLS